MVEYLTPCLSPSQNLAIEHRSCAGVEKKSTKKHAGFLFCSFNLLFTVYCLLFTYCLLLFFFLRSHCRRHHIFVISTKFLIKWFKIIRKGPTAHMSWVALYCLPQEQCSLVFHKMCLYSLRVSSPLYTFQNLPTWYVHLCLKVHYLILNPCWINQIHG